MKQRYKVKTIAGIDLGGKIFPQGRVFDPRPEFENWCEQAVRSGALERIEESETKKKSGK